MKKKLGLHLPAFVLLMLLQMTMNAQKNWLLKGNSGTNISKNYLGTNDLKDLVFKTDSVERMRLSKTGNLGIGITSPKALLHVAYNYSVSLSQPGSMVLGATNDINLGFDGNEVQARNNGSGSTLYLNYWGGSTWIGNHNGSPVPSVFASANGEVGIGSNTTQAGFAITVNPFSTGGAIYLNDPGDGNFILGTKSGNTGEGLRMNISSTSNPYAAIRGHTDGNGYGVLAEATGAFGFGLEGYSSQSYGVWGGTGNSLSYAAYFSGDVFASGTYYASDEKLKQDIREFTSAMDIINQLHPRQYHYRQDGNYKLMNLPQGQHFGLIAQDVEKILPNLVKDTRFDPAKAVPSSDNKDLKNAEAINFKALNYTELIPVMIKGMQEQQQLINKQQQQIDELKQMVQALTNSGSSSINTGNVRLDQNNPNPFSQNTIIRCYVPASVHQAQLVVYSITGTQLQSFSLQNTGMNEVTITAGSLSSGHYTYALIADGKKIDSKSMILTK